MMILEALNAYGIPLSVIITSANTHDMKAAKEGVLHTYVIEEEKNKNG
jgi:hypothetical protein